MFNKPLAARSWAPVTFPTVPSCSLSELMIDT